MKWFGPASWGAPVCVPEGQVPMPSTPCTRCKDPFVASDQGFVIPASLALGEPEEARPYHRNCLAMDFGFLTVHVLHQGLALCDFSNAVPGHWPNGHLWVSTLEWTRANCPACRSLGEPLDKELRARAAAFTRSTKGGEP